MYKLSQLVGLPFTTGNIAAVPEGFLPNSELYAAQIGTSLLNVEAQVFIRNHTDLCFVFLGFFVFFFTLHTRYILKLAWVTCSTFGRLKTLVGFSLCYLLGVSNFFVSSAPHPKNIKS